MRNAGCGEKRTTDSFRVRVRMNFFSSLFLMLVVPATWLSQSLWIRMNAVFGYATRDSSFFVCPAATSHCKGGPCPFFGSSAHWFPPIHPSLAQTAEKLHDF